MSIFCRHDWELISETKTKSKIEQMIEMGANPTTVPAYMMEKKLIQILKCKKCSKLKRFVEEI